MTTPSANLDEVYELLGHADVSLVQRVVDTGASLDEIGTAIDDLEGIRRYGEPRVPMSPRVAQVRRILEGLYAGEDGGSTFPIAGVLI
jgi:hypothetical protein